MIYCHFCDKILVEINGMLYHYTGEDNKACRKIIEDRMRNGEHD